MREITYELRKWIWSAYDNEYLDDLGQSQLLDIANSIDRELRDRCTELPRTDMLESMPTVETAPATSTFSHAIKSIMADKGITQ